MAAQGHQRSDHRHRRGGLLLEGVRRLEGIASVKKLEGIASVEKNASTADVTES